MSALFKDDESSGSNFVKMVVAGAMAVSSFSIVLGDMLHRAPQCMDEHGSMNKTVAMAVDAVKDALPTVWFFIYTSSLAFFVYYLILVNQKKNSAANV